MPVGLYDAHNHLATSALRPQLKDIQATLTEIGLRKSVVNGTSPEDWQDVLALSQRDPSVLPAIGLHPWKVNHAPDDWQSSFLHAFDNGAKVVGEVGLDQWIDDHDIERQQSAFHWQLAQAYRNNYPISIHCLRAIGPLMETVRSAQLPDRGIHIHAYNGSIELIPELVEMNTYFSFNAGQFKPNAKTVYEAIRQIPIERLLIETDAPDMLPPEEHRAFSFASSNTEKNPLNHPANIHAAYKAVAFIREIEIEALTEQVANNFQTYFL